MEYSAIKNLYGFEDGDCITPGMGVQIAAGYGLHQYYNSTTGNVIQTDFTQHNAVLFPQAYSSKTATIVVPSVTVLPGEPLMTRGPVDSTDVMSRVA